MTSELVERAQRAGVEVIDASDVFRNAVLDGQQVFLDKAYDIHFNGAGNALWAQWLHEQLAEDSLRPRRE